MSDTISINRTDRRGGNDELINVADWLGSKVHGSASNALAIMARDSGIFTQAVHDMAKEKSARKGKK